MHSRRGHLEIALHIALCGWPTMELGIVIDEGQILSLFWRIVGLAGGRCMFDVRFDIIASTCLYRDHLGFEIRDIFLWEVFFDGSIVPPSFFEK